MNDRGLRSGEICTRSSGYVCRRPEFPQGLCRSRRNVRLELREIVPETCVKKSSQCDSVASAAVGQPPSSRIGGTTASQGGPAFARLRRGRGGKKIRGTRRPARGFSSSSSFSISYSCSSPAPKLPQVSSLYVGQ